MVDAVHLGVDCACMATDQASDPDVQAYRMAIMSLQLADVSFDGAGFVWHGLQKVIRDWVNTCVECQRAKVHRHIKERLEMFKVTEKWLNHVNVDLVGPLPLLASTTTADVAWVFIGTWVAQFSTLSDLSSDHGPQFTSELWSEVARSLGVTLHHTTTYHPQAKGLCERFHRSMKPTLRANLKDDSWCDWLPWVLLGIRTAPRKRTFSLQLRSWCTDRHPECPATSSLMPPWLSWSASLQRSTHLSRAEAFVLVPTSRHGLPQSRVLANLHTAEFVFVPHDEHRGPAATAILWSFPRPGAGG
ncbi:hypothetical protein AAFF_G00193430 [Aldrovandia affinis]|uniref:Gypsy retrotransposon integrase-like protein 1 n=1 Tax=Aldrovandia affinis TaxID=143900 RepID=A0AAD7SX75_9TELE|nr:hypothetical protein AAFF_G00193430 [Aldrovandia affinis]